MKKVNIISIAILFGMIALQACTDILEKPVSNDLVAESVFSSREYSEAFLWGAYNGLVPKGFPLSTTSSITGQYSEQFPNSILASISDECCNVKEFSRGRFINNQGFNPVADNNVEDGYGYRWAGMRNAFQFIENADRIPDTVIPAEEKEIMKAEAWTLVALAYQEMLVRYGGVPIIKQSYNDPLEVKSLRRNSVKEVVDYIVSICDRTVEVLPDYWPSNWRGRVTKGVALAIKSRVLLFAASPFFNCRAEDMVLPYEHPELICYCDYDKERWLAAAKAAYDVLDWAQDYGRVALITADDIPGGEINNKANAYGYATSVEDNKEIILAFKGYTPSQTGFSSSIYFKFVSSGLSVMQNYIENFRKSDGSDQQWPEVMKERRPFAEYSQKVKEMEPRFYQCCWPVGTSAPNFSGVGDYSSWPVSKVDDVITTSDMHGACPMVKFHYNYEIKTKMKDWTVFRLAEFYLNYAEAISEYYGSPDARLDETRLSAREAVDVIRNRGRLRKLTDAECASPELFRVQVRRERAVELFAEGHRWFDCRRWKIADETFGKRLTTLRYVQNSTKKKYEYYYLDQHMERYWNKAMYLYPFPQEEVDKGYLIQNPGY